MLTQRPRADIHRDANARVVAQFRRLTSADVDAIAAATVDPPSVIDATRAAVSNRIFADAATLDRYFAGSRSLALAAERSDLGPCQVAAAQVAADAALLSVAALLVSDLDEVGPSRRNLAGMLAAPWASVMGDPITAVACYTPSAARDAS